MGHALERAVTHQHQALGVCRRHVILVAGEDDVRHVMSDRAPIAHSRSGASDGLDSFKRSDAHGAHVVDDVGTEDLVKSIEMASVKYVSVQRQDLVDGPAVFSLQHGQSFQESADLRYSVQNSTEYQNSRRT